MAYLIGIVRRCAWLSCEKQATNELHNQHSGKMGCFCDRHSKMRLAEVEQAERAFAVAQRLKHPSEQLF